MAMTTCGSLMTRWERWEGKMRRERKTPTGQKKHPITRNMVDRECYQSTDAASPLTGLRYGDRLRRTVHVRGMK